MRQKRNKFEYYSLLTLTAIVLLIISVFFLARYGQLSITGFAIGTSVSEYNVYILDSFEGEDITFVIPLQNIGQSRINKSYAEIEILDSGNKNVKMLTTDSISLNESEKRELKAIWYEAGKAGEYQVRITVFSNSESYSFSKSFKIDRKTVTFESIIVNDFKLGEVTNFDILVQNHIDEDILDISAGILVYDDAGNIISEMRSARENLSQNSIKKLSVSWDTKSVESGKYNAKLVLDYGNESSERDIVMNIEDESLEVIGVGYSIANQPQKSKSALYVIIFFIVLLVLVNLSWIIIYRKARK